MIYYISMCKPDKDLGPKNILDISVLSLSIILLVL